MRLYFFTPQTRERKLVVAYERVQAVLKSASIETTTSAEGAEGLPDDMIKAAEHRSEPLLEQMDALIIEGSSADSEIGYLLAFAIARKKPTLYLTDRTTSSFNPLRYLPAKSLPKNLMLKTYTKEGLEGIVMTFLRSIDAGAIREVPSIKFTLRITPSIDKYLDWKTHNTDGTKADFLREEIDRMVKDDEQYQKFLRKGE